MRQLAISSGVPSPYTLNCADSHSPLLLMGSEWHLWPLLSYWWISLLDLTAFWLIPWFQHCTHWFLVRDLKVPPPYSVVNLLVAHTVCNLILIPSDQGSILQQLCAHEVLSGTINYSQAAFSTASSPHQSHFSVVCLPVLWWGSIHRSPWSRLQPGSHYNDLDDSQ